MQCIQTKNVNAQKMVSTGNEVSGLRQGKRKAFVNERQTWLFVKVISSFHISSLE